MTLNVKTIPWESKTYEVNQWDRFIDSLDDSVRKKLNGLCALMYIDTNDDRIRLAAFYNYDSAMLRCSQIKATIPNLQYFITSIPDLDAPKYPIIDDITLFHAEYKRAQGIPVFDKRRMFCEVKIGSSDGYVLCLIDTGCEPRFVVSG